MARAEDRHSEQRMYHNKTSLLTIAAPSFARLFLNLAKADMPWSGCKVLQISPAQVRTGAENFCSSRGQSHTVDISRLFRLSAEGAAC